MRVKVWELRVEVSELNVKAGQGEAGAEVDINLREPGGQVREC